MQAERGAQAFDVPAASFANPTRAMLNTTSKVVESPRLLMESKNNSINSIAWRTPMLVALRRAF